ncbi:hypothetical protein RJ640_015229 [Escallonia rubra]|uniref:Uncharacterized protein n=1 Tax=Escallonia rubra TaxID=112253 RepID=A0AA88R2R2_9ASTE|nr:hypothetical protein RJ640_015229 [Escallonia rubra]
MPGGRTRLMFLLIALRIFNILDSDLSPPLKEPRTSTEDVPPDTQRVERVKKERKKHDDDELLCHGHILNRIALNYEFKAEEKGMNIYIIAQYFDFVMADDKPMLEKVHALQVIINKIRALKVILPESFQTGAIIAKLYPSLKVYRKRLLHKSKDFTLEQFQKHVCFEEESHKRDNKVIVPIETNVHYVDRSGSKSKNSALQVRSNDEQFKKKANQDGGEKRRKEAAMFA